MFLGHWPLVFIVEFSIYLGSVHHQYFIQVINLCAKPWLTKLSCIRISFVNNTILLTRTLDYSCIWCWLLLLLGSQVLAKSVWFRVFRINLPNIDFRLVHEVNLGWSAHQVHHSSEDYNLSTAMRQSLLQFWFMQIPCLAAAVLGVHPSMFWTHYRYE